MVAQRSQRLVPVFLRRHDYPPFSVGHAFHGLRVPNVFQRRFRNPTSPFATRRLPRDGLIRCAHPCGAAWRQSISASLRFPAFNRYYGDAKTASALLSRLRLKLGARYLGSLSLSWRPEPKTRLRSRILLSRCDPIPAFSRGDRRLSRASLKTPSPLCRALRPRADLHAKPLRRFGVVPAITNTKTPPFIFLSRLFHTALQLAAYA